MQDDKALPDWLTATAANLVALPTRYWLVLALIFSGKAMILFLPTEQQQADWLLNVEAAAAFLVRFWLPYLLIRVMAGHPQPWRPTLAFLIFVFAALLFALIAALPSMAAHRLFMEGITFGQPEIVMLLAGLLSAVLVARFLPLFAGTATAILSPLERHWWRGINGSALSLIGASLLIALVGPTVRLAVPLPGPAFELSNILLAHVYAAADLFTLVAVLALAVAAMTYAARLQGAPAAR
ncbi:MAG: hypothetical protein WA906_11785 [Pacificimonas sp.]